MHKKKNLTYHQHLNNFIRYKNNLIKAASREELDDVDINLTPEDVAKYTIQNIESQLKPLNFFQTVGDMLDHIQPYFSKNDFYAIRGPGMPIMINKPSVNIGRKTLFDEDIEIDIDLSHFNLKKVSRLHANIRLASDMNFYLTVFGRNAIINGELFIKGKIIQIHNSDVIDLGGFVFIFVENGELMNQLRHAL